MKLISSLFFLNFMSCHHIILHDMLINVNKISLKLLLGLEWPNGNGQQAKPSQETRTRTQRARRPLRLGFPPLPAFPRRCSYALHSKTPQKQKASSVSVSSPHPIHPPLHDHDVQASIHPRRRLRAIASVLCFPRLPEPRIHKALRWGSRIWDRRAHRSSVASLSNVRLQRCGATTRRPKAPPPSFCTVQHSELLQHQLQHSSILIQSPFQRNCASLPSTYAWSGDPASLELTSSFVVQYCELQH